MQENPHVARANQPTAKRNSGRGQTKPPMRSFLGAFLVVVFLVVAPVTPFGGAKLSGVGAKPALAETLKTGARYHAETPTPVVPSGDTHEEEAGGGHGHGEAESDSGGHSGSNPSNADDHGDETSGHGESAVDAHGQGGDAGGHSDSHGKEYAPPSDFTRGVVLGGFAGINGIVIVAAAILKKRMPKKPRTKVPGVTTEETGDSSQ